MDPAALYGPEWSDIGTLLSNLWIMVALVVFFATNMMVGHVLIPSLVASAHLPVAIQRVRPLFYGLAIASIVGAFVVLLDIIAATDVLERFWDTYWI